MNDPLMAENRVRVSESERAEWVGKFKSSGLTQREFAGQHGLKLSTLQYWVVRESRRRVGRKGRSQGGVFAEVKLAATAGAGGWAAELVRPGRATLRVARELSPALLEQLLRAC